MTVQDLATGNLLQAKISLANSTLDAYTHFHTTMGLQPTQVVFNFGDYGSVVFDDQASLMVNDLLTSFISNVTTYRDQLQQQFDALGSSGAN